MKNEFVRIRHEIHRHPELGFEEFRTSQLIARLLREYGYEVTTGIAKTGVIGVMHKGSGTKSLGLRADMDALPLQEEVELEYKSEIPNKMHACGHDGHVTTLLMTAKRLIDIDFDGRVVLIFQPSEEKDAGAQRMIEDGLFERFDVDYIFGYHNIPMHDTKKIFFVKNGAMMAGVDSFRIVVHGIGTHGSTPNMGVNPILIAHRLLADLSLLTTQNIDAQESVVLSVCSFSAGDEKNYNIIPAHASMNFTLRTLNSDVRDTMIAKIKNLCAGYASLHSVQIEINFSDHSPVTWNSASAYEIAREVGIATFGVDNCEFEFKSLMASEDFSYFTRAKPGAYIFLNNGPSEYLHNPRYVFNDELLVHGSDFFVNLVCHYLR